MTVSDVARCGTIMYESFKKVHDAHGAISDFESPDVALRIARAFADDPSVFSVVAEADGTIAGCNFLLERDRVKTIGPTCVDDAFQGRGIGRAMMEATLEHARGENIRLLQDLFNVQSLSLYASVGFAMKEPLVQMWGRVSEPPQQDGRSVRPMQPDDTAGCNALCTSVHGFDRANELDEALILHEPFVVERAGRIVGYLSAANNRLANHGVACTFEDMKALISGMSATHPGEIAILVPARDFAFVGWCLRNGFKARKCSSLMVIGDYTTPNGSYFPSPHY